MKYFLILVLLILDISVMTFTAESLTKGVSCTNVTGLRSKTANLLKDVNIYTTYSDLKKKLGQPNKKVVDPNHPELEALVPAYFMNNGSATWVLKNKDMITVLFRSGACVGTVIVNGHTIMDMSNMDAEITRLKMNRDLQELNTTYY